MCIPCASTSTQEDAQGSTGVAKLQAELTEAQKQKAELEERLRALRTRHEEKVGRVDDVWQTVVCLLDTEMCSA